MRPIRTHDPVHAAPRTAGRRGPGAAGWPDAGRAGLLRRLRSRLRTHGGPERGDVPGWVLVTLMTAGLVVTLWAVAGPRLAEVFESSISSVQGPGG